ncbi:MAG: Ig-like domain-containing protein [Gemmatimonadetes bacterium]|nr:Ig-like domain-containing protein [Gemmatimonadota bacterium]
MRTLRRWSASVAAVVVLACGGKDATQPVTPASLQIVSGQGQTSAVGSTVVIGVAVLGRSGSGVTGVAVNWAVVEGGGSMATSTTTGTDGRTQANWTLGTRAGAQKASASVTGLAAVTFEATAQPGALASVSISPDTMRLTALGDTARCTAAAADQYGNAIDGATFSWASSDPTIASLEGSGLVRARGAGTARIVATSSGRADTTLAIVTQTPTALQLTPAADTLNAIGDTLVLAAAVTDRNGNAVAGAAVQWSSLDSAVASVDSRGYVVSRAVGTALIRAASGAVADTASILVRQVVATLTLSRDTATMLTDSTLQLSATARDSNGVAAAAAQITWASSDTRIASVSAAGLVRALDPGAVRVIAAAGTPADTATITVTERWVLRGFVLGPNAGHPGEEPSMNDVIMLPDGTYRMYYSKAARAIKYADSPDGVTWTVRGTVLEGASDPNDREYSVNGPRVLRLPDGRYRMYYQVGPQPAQGQAPRFYVRSLISQDGGVTFTKEGIRIEIFPFDPTSPVEFAGHASFYRLADGSYAGIVSVHYTNEQGPSDLALVRSADGLTWTGFTQTHEDWHDPIVIPVPGGYRMYATYLLERTGTAFSADGVTWSDFTEIRFVNAAGTRLTEDSDGVGDIGGLRLSTGRIRLYTSWGIPSSDIIYFEK